MNKILVIGSELTLIEKETLVTGSKNHFKLEFEFSEEWEGLEKILTYRIEGEAPIIAPLVDPFYVSEYVLSKARRFTIGLTGLESDKVRISTRLISFKPKAGAYESLETNESPQVFDEYLSLISKEAQVAMDSKKAAIASKEQTTKNAREVLENTLRVETLETLLNAGYKDVIAAKNEINDDKVAISSLAQRTDIEALTNAALEASERAVKAASNAEILVDQIGNAGAKAQEALTLASETSLQSMKLKELIIEKELINSKEYPFNDSETLISFKEIASKYSVIIEMITPGEVRIYDRAKNGFKAKLVGSKLAKVRFRVKELECLD